MYSEGKKKPRKSTVYADFGDFFVYSHSVRYDVILVVSPDFKPFSSPFPLKIF